MNYFLMDNHKFSLPFENEEDKAIKEIIQDYLAHGTRVWEPETTKIVKENVKEDSICVDVGASIGYFTLLFARLGRMVYSFEPTANQYEYLCANIRLNDYTNVIPHNLAAWDKTEDNFVRRDNLGHGNKIQINNTTTEGMKGVALDEVLPEKVDFIKIDVDGSEPRVLKGLIKTFERNPQLKLIIEYYPECIKKLGNNPKEMLDILDKYFIYSQIKGDLGRDYWNYFAIRRTKIK